MTNHNDQHTYLRPIGDEFKVSIGNGANFLIKGVGTIYFRTKKGLMHELKDVLSVLDLARSMLCLVSITYLDSHLCFDKKDVVINIQRSQKEQHL